MQLKTRNIQRILVLLLLCSACARQPTLPASSRYNVLSVLNDSVWFATGKAIRLVRAGQEPEAVKQFNLQIMTDIDYSDNEFVTRSAAITGCTGDCLPTQRLHIYNIPLRRSKFKIHRLDKRRTVDMERTNYWLLLTGIGSGVRKNYKYEGCRPNWLRITRYDHRSNTIEGTFSLSLDEDTTIYNRLINSIPPVALFRRGVFRAKLDNVRLKD